MSWTDWIDGIYAAGLGEESWEEAVRPIKESFGCSCFALMIRAHRHGVPITDEIVRGIPTEALERYSEFDDPLAPHVVRQPSGVLVTPESLGIATSLHQSAYHNEWAAPIGLDYNLCGWAELSSDDMLAIGAHRRKSAEPFSRSEAAILERVVPHLARAARLHRDRTDLGALSELLDNQLVGRGCATLVIDSRLRVIWRSAASESFIESHPAIRPGRRLELADRAAHERLRSAVDLALGRGQSSRVRAGELHFEIQPMPPRCAVFVTSDQWRASSGAWLRQSYRLTAAEASVAIALASGMSPAEIADSRSVSRGTVRTQLKRIFTKLGVRRQAELVALVSRLPTS